MSSEFIGYRFSHIEINALCSLLSLPFPPGLRLPEPDEDAYRAAVRSLTAAGIVTPTGERLCVDRMTALLLNASIAHSGGIALHSDARDTLLYRTRLLYLVIDCPLQGMLTLTPVQTADEAQSLLEDALPRHCGPVTIDLFSSAGDVLSSRSSDSDAAVEVRKLCQDFL